MTHLWIDASAGIAGDMLLGALHDAGAPLDRIQAAVDAVLPGAVRISAAEVRRGGLRARKVEVTALAAEQPHRTWRDISGMLDRASRAAASGSVPVAAAEVFARLAHAEAAVHGVDPADVHFHEVGALDAIADVVGVCAAIDALGVTGVSAGAVSLGSGTVRSAHGLLPVPAPAVAELSRGWQVSSGGTASHGTGSHGSGELATPTGMALLRTLATTCEDLPALTLSAVGVGAGTRDTPGRPNVVRALLGQRAATPPDTCVLLEANVDDLDPRLWPGVLTALLDAGADDAWLTPILMKKGRPAHTLAALCSPATAAAVRSQIFRTTTTLGVRGSARTKTAMDRIFVTVDVAGHPVPIKVGHTGGLIVQATPEFDDVAALARTLGLPERDALGRAAHAARAAGLTAGQPAPGA
ncbi:nickel pincer cofactor biosynthesis protein LarC [Actinoplanes sp. NPDC023936]|uniref:nickel pincer cofactor biosynthesis protein LarC n=1 Tax=Actinoplanes sp. NPDC023936 TaxID=3154910 RepID=UPI0033E70A2C